MMRKTGDWYIERTINGRFETYAEGYETLTKAKAAAGRQGKSNHFSTTWRCVNTGDDGPQIYQAKYAPGRVAIWEKVL
jgi:hypothetical protein